MLVPVLVLVLVVGKLCLLPSLESVPSLVLACLTPLARQVVAAQLVAALHLAMVVVVVGGAGWPLVQSLQPLPQPHC